MYFPKHRPQLRTGIPTASVDCGVRSTQMGLDWLSKGKVVPSVDGIRDIMNDDDATNYSQWDYVIDELGGRTLGFKSVMTNEREEVVAHLNAGGASIVAVHYGSYRSLMPGKSGSKTFNGYHAILFVGARRRGGTPQTRSFDSLLDGRYKGCPDGPVWVPTAKVMKSAVRVGRLEAGEDKVYAVNLYRDASLAPSEPGDLLEPVDTLVDVLSDLYALEDESMQDTIDALEAIIGLSRSEDESGIEVSEGIFIDIP